jgi:hypothetical protein
MRTGDVSQHSEGSELKIERGGVDSGDKIRSESAEEDLASGSTHSGDDSENGPGDYEGRGNVGEGPSNLKDTDA